MLSHKVLYWVRLFMSPRGVSMKNYILQFDGGCEPKNPGGYAIGSYILRDEDNHVISKGAELICKGEGATNNVAEWGGLILGLKAVPVDDPGDVFVLLIGDSNLILTQLMGTTKTKKPHLRVMRKAAMKLLEPMNWGIRWIPRRFNEEADQLGRVKYRQLLRESKKEKVTA